MSMQAIIFHNIYSLREVNSVLVIMLIKIN